MSPRAFQRRDFDELERRRMRGARLLHQGISQAEVARQVKVSRESVRRWANRMAQEGAAAALRKAGRAGRKPRLSEKQLQQLEARLREGAEKAGFPNGLWTLERVAGVIREQFGVEYHSGQRVVDLAPETRLELPAAGRTSRRAKRGRHPQRE